MKRSLVLIALLLAAACGGAGAHAPAASGGEPAFERVLDRVGDDGAMDKDTALQAFALAFTPPPGVSRPPGPSETIESGSGPLRWVLAHLAELTPAQRAAVLAVVPRPAAVHTLAADPERAQFVALAGEAWSYWSRIFPKSILHHPIDFYPVELNTTNKFNARAYADAVDAQGGRSGPVDACWIYVNPTLRAGTDPEKREAMYHEVFHCFEAQMVPDLANYNAVPSKWLIEGGAAYAMDFAMVSIGAPTPVGATFWKTYFQTPATPLFRRAYSAIGYFAHLAETGTDVMGRFPAAMRAVVGQGGNAAAFNAFLAGGGAERFFSTWPTSLLRKPALGSEWDASGPGITPDATVPANVIADNNSAPVAGRVAAYANDDRWVAVSSDVLLVSSRPYARMRATGGLFDSSAPSDVYCTKGASGCMCPQGSPQAGIKFKDLNRGSYYLAMSGGPSGAAWSLTPLSLDQLCKQPAADSCLYGTWRLQGLPALPLPANVTITRVDETVTITQDGVLAFTVDIADSVTVQGGPTATGEVKGPLVVKALMLSGMIQPVQVDLSGLGAHAQVGPIAIDIPVAQLVPDISGELTPVAYQCSGSTLLFTSVNGTVFTFAKA